MRLKRWFLGIWMMLLPFQLGFAPRPTILIPEQPAPLSSDLQSLLNKSNTSDSVPIIVRLKSNQPLPNLPAGDRSERLKQLILSLQSRAKTSQASLQPWLLEKKQQGQVSNTVFLWSINAVALQATPQAIQQLVHLPIVQSISQDASIDAPVSFSSTLAYEPNLIQINVDDIHLQGWDGFGVVIASLDTGVNFTHPDLINRWRAGTNSWFDPYHQHLTPYDPSGHGTAVMGVMLGGDAGGTSIGIAPGARWISAKIFNDSGKATTSAIHAAYQWILDPDNNPETPDAPHIVNNSWGGSVPGCNLEFQADLQLLLTAGILPIFSAGNLGPSLASNASPANLPEAFSVGSVDSLDQVALSSSRGPSNCSTDGIFPSLVAPGVNILSAERSDLYGVFSGTSFAAPHASGLLALILQAYPWLTVDQQRQALLAATIDLPPTSPDNQSGQGRLDALAGFSWLECNFGSPTSLPLNIYLPVVLYRP